MASRIPLGRQLLLLSFVFGCDAQTRDDDTSSTGVSTGSDADSGATGPLGTSTGSESGASDDESTPSEVDTSNGSESTSDSVVETTTESTGDAPDGITCPDGALAPGRYEGLTFPFAGEIRRYDLFVPEAHDGTTALPVAFNLHGYLSNSVDQAEYSLFDEAAGPAGFIAVYPQAKFNSWNAGSCCGEAAENDNDDVGYMRALVDEVALRTCIDRDRVYATGMSNGGFMSHRLACEAADVFAAIAPVAGVMGLEPEECTPSRPVPVLDFHGTADSIVSYEGGSFTSVADTIAGWVARNGCEGEPRRTLYLESVYCDSYDSCDGDVEVTLCTIVDGGHCWPGNPDCTGSFSTVELSATEAMLEFFSRYELP